MSARQIILITGATAGIGKEAALTLAREGHRVFATGRNAEALQALQAEAADLPLETFELDVNDADSIQTAAAEVDQRTEGHGLDVLINNAGYGRFSPTALVTDAELRGQFETNVFGLVRVTQSFLPAMRARGSGRIINISSVMGQISFILLGVYCATKHAVEALTDCLRREVAGFGVQVSLVEPGMIRTNFEQTAGEHISGYEGDPVYSKALQKYTATSEKLYSMSPGPAPVVRTISRAVSARKMKARYITPAINRLGLWLMRLLPTRLMDFVLRKVAGL